MKRAFLITFFITILSAACLHAIPAYPGKIKVTQPDGSSLYILKHGDEWGHWTTGAQGRMVVKDAEGYYRPVADTRAQSIRRQALAHRSQKRSHRGQYASPGIANGQKRFLVILVQFPDCPFSTANPQTAFNNMMNQKGYSANGATGSAADYYYQNSKGVFDPSFDVYGPVTVSHEMAYYGGNDEN